MNSSSFSFLFKQGLRNMWLNRVMSLASIGILTACLIILGGAGLIGVNMSGLYQTLERENKIEVFILEDATQAQINSMGDRLEEMEYVESVVFISKDEAVAVAQERFGYSDEVAERLRENNSLPASYRVVLANFEHVPDFVAEAESLPGVEMVSAPSELAETMTNIRNTALIVGGIIIGILLIASVVVISNTIKLTVFNRRREINIMRYVGATNRFIRMPFKVEGLAIGFISAVVAFGIIFAVYQSLEVMMTKSTVSWLAWASQGMISFSQLWYWVLGAFLVSGMLIGMFGSTSAMKKHLKV